MSTVLLVIEALLSALICAMILIQQRAAGLTAGFSGVNSLQVQRRGAERVMYNLTIAFSVALVLLSMAQWYIA